VDLAVLGLRLDRIRASVDLINNYRLQLLSQIVIAGEPIEIPPTAKARLEKQIQGELETLYKTVEILKKEASGE